MWGNLSSALQVEVFWTKDYRVINAVCNPESCFLSMLLKSVSILIQPRILKASALSPACGFHNKNCVSINFYWMCCHICRNSVLTELLFPEPKCLKRSKETSFKSAEEHPMIQKGLLSICCQCSHLSLYAHLAPSKILIEYKQDVLDSQNHTSTQQPLWTLLRK